MGRQLGFKHSEETKLKISQANKGRKLPPFTEEHKAKIGAAHKGQVPANKGTYLVMVDGKRTYRRHSDECNETSYIKKTEEGIQK